MTKLEKLKKLKNRDNVIRYVWRMLAKKKVFSFLSDEQFIKLEYRVKTGKKLDLKNPKRFNEKLQWLKLHDRNPMYTKLVDKYEVREYVRNMIGDDYLIPDCGVYDSYEDIDFSALPNEFILKPTHTSGNVFICKDKSDIDHSELKQTIDKWLNTNYYHVHREYPYKNVKPRVICETFMVDESGTELKDYKFFCFNGQVELMFIASNRRKGTKFDFFDKEFNRLDVSQHYPNSDQTWKKPEHYDEMIRLSEQLSKGMPHVRVDLYSINGKIYFGELTFYHMSGYELFEPDAFDFQLGEKLELPERK